MPKLKDITGQKFGKLTVLYRLHNYHKHGVYWLCVCECGNLNKCKGTELRRGNIKSCSCGVGNFKHGKKQHRLYRIWSHIKERCYRTNCDNYQYYGKRGITMCDEWLNNFMTFYNWSIEKALELTI